MRACCEVRHLPRVCLDVIRLGEVRLCARQWRERRSVLRGKGPLVDGGEMW